VPFLEAIVARRISLLFLAVASPLLLILFAAPFPGADVLFTLLVMAYPAALIVIAVSREGRVGPIGSVLMILLIMLEAGAVGMLVLRGNIHAAPWIAGLPLAAAIQLYGLGLAPLLLVALGYALTFDRYELRRDDLDRLAQRARSRDPRQ
jgi:hypothetical protein